MHTHSGVFPQVFYTENPALSDVGEGAGEDDEVPQEGSCEVHPEVNWLMHECTYFVVNPSHVHTHT